MAFRSLRAGCYRVVGPGLRVLMLVQVDRAWKDNVDTNAFVLAFA